LKLTRAVGRRTLDYSVHIANSASTFVNGRRLANRPPPATKLAVPYEFDPSGWPVLIFRFLGRLNTADGERYFCDSNALIAGDRSYVCVMDGSTMLVPEAEFVRRQAVWIRNNRVAMQRLNQGIAFVTPSALIRGLVGAIIYFQEMPVPHRLFGTVDEATVWAQGRAQLNASRFA
jgi:hypothetical protein